MNRERPQYGEYATPEEQRAAIKQPMPPAEITPVPAMPEAVPGQDPVAVGAAAATPERRRFWDRAVTIALLAYGLFNLIATVPMLADFDAFAATWMEFAGIDAAFTNSAQGATWGIIGAVVYAVGYLATAFWAWRWMAAGRLSFWIPIVGAVVTFVLLTVCLLPPLVNDPAVIEYFLNAGRG